jgi:tRNA pseudouridine32 synthase/23S rRNA pseudouridine746 synthase
MPTGATWVTVADFLLARTRHAPGVVERLAAGEVLLGDGTVVTSATAYRPGQWVYLHRDLPDEVPVPGEVTVLLHDEDTGLLAVDKPPFLATTPRGSHVAQSVVVRLRRELGLPHVAPVHRLDRLTSGVLLLTTRREARSAYQRMVQDGGLAKTYEAIARVRDDLELPLTVRNRLVKRRGQLQAAVEPGEPNAVTRVELAERVDPTVLAGAPGRLPGGRPVGRYLLTPTTGQTHQLRVHLAGLGIPIVGDPLYPEVVAVARDDFTSPLQLLARGVRFVDPLTGGERRIESARELPVTAET